MQYVLSLLVGFGGFITGWMTIFVSAAADGRSVTCSGRQRKSKSTGADAGTGQGRPTRQGSDDRARTAEVVSIEEKQLAFQKMARELQGQGVLAELAIPWTQPPPEPKPPPAPKSAMHKEQLLTHSFKQKLAELERKQQALAKSQARQTRAAEDLAKATANVQEAQHEHDEINQQVDKLLKEMDVAREESRKELEEAEAARCKRSDGLLPPGRAGKREEDMSDEDDDGNGVDGDGLLEHPQSKRRRKVLTKRSPEEEALWSTFANSVEKLIEKSTVEEVPTDILSADLVRHAGSLCHELHSIMAAKKKKAAEDAANAVQQAKAAAEAAGVGSGDAPMDTTSHDADVGVPGADEALDPEQARKLKDAVTARSPLLEPPAGLPSGIKRG